MDIFNKICTQCPLHMGCAQIVLATPNPIGGLLAIGEAPGADEDIKGEGFVGTAGKTLDKLLLAHGISREQYGRANVCRCRPPGNRKPKSNEIDACVPYLAELIRQTKPKVILTVGGTPTSVFLGKGALNKKIDEGDKLGYHASRSTEQAHSSLKFLTDCHIVPMPHTSPLAFNRNAPSGEKWKAVAERQVAKAVDLLGN